MINPMSMFGMYAVRNLFIPDSFFNVQENGGGEYEFTDTLGFANVTNGTTEDDIGDSFDYDITISDLTSGDITLEIGQSDKVTFNADGVYSGTILLSLSPGLNRPRVFSSVVNIGAKFSAVTVIKQG